MGGKISTTGGAWSEYEHPAVYAEPPHKLEPPAGIEELVLEGEVILPSQTSEYTRSRAIWNFDAAGFPNAVVRPKNATDISKCVKFAVRHNLDLCVRSAGAHSSHAMVNGCLAIDMSCLRNVEVDAEARTAVVEGGAMIMDVDSATRPHGLALPMGHVYHTGVAGMVLNATSGVGYLCRTRGLCCTYILEVELINAKGDILLVNEASDPDLFWALKGAGSNFGIASKIKFRLTTVCPEVLCGDIIQFPVEAPGPMRCCCVPKKTRYELVQSWVDFYDNSPHEATSLIVMAPKGPVITRAAYLPMESGTSYDVKAEKAKAQELYAEQLQSFPDYKINMMGLKGYWQGLQKLGKFMPSYYYQKGANLLTLPPDALKKLVKFADTAPIKTMGTAIILMPLGGAMKDMAPDLVPTADLLGKAKYWCIIIAEFPRGPANPQLREACIKWVRAAYETILPYAAQDPQTGNRQEDYWFQTLGDTYGNNLPRLVELKRKHDPTNFFRNNRNINPDPTMAPHPTHVVATIESDSKLPGVATTLLTQRRLESKNRDSKLLEEQLVDVIPGSVSS